MLTRTISLFFKMFAAATIVQETSAGYNMVFQTEALSNITTEKEKGTYFCEIYYNCLIYMFLLNLAGLVESCQNK